MHVILHAPANVPELNTYLLLRLRICSKFYDRLKELREYHKRFPVYDISAAEDDSDLIKEEPKVVFTGEEANGR